MLINVHIGRFFWLIVLLALSTPDKLLPATYQLKNGMFTKQINDQKKFSEDSLLKYKTLAIQAAQRNDLQASAFYAEEYVKYSAELGFVDSRYFQKFQNTLPFIELKRKYSFHFDWLHFFYLFSALSGFFIGIVLLLKKGQDRVAKGLISVFVLIHSLFIFHIFLYNTNLNYKEPNVLYMSAAFSYLYGPLIYFYFKRITSNYKFLWRDMLHLLPTFLVIVLLFPIYLLPESEKLNIMLEVGSFDRLPYLYGVVLTKAMSLAIYGYLLFEMYRQNVEHREYPREVQRWLNILVSLVIAYVASYVIYGLTISEVIPRSDFLYHLQIILMASMVLYIGYASYLKPSLLAGPFQRKQEKYTKSGLTESYSQELKSCLLQLMEEEKIYLNNDISLDELAERMQTTRHNASQVINEHFGLNFFELINKYRIQDAVALLENDRRLNIIDVAYQVGFNNKVTFNKSFKKFLAKTPTQFLKAL